MSNAHIALIQQMETYFVHIFFYSVNHIISFLGRKLSVACLLYIKMIFSLDSINHLLFIKARYPNKSILGCGRQTSGVSTNHHDIWINWPTSKMFQNIHIRISAFFSTFFVHHSHYSFIHEVMPFFTRMRSQCFHRKLYVLIKFWFLIAFNRQFIRSSGRRFQSNG